MNVEQTEPLSVEQPPARRVDPWKILACVSTAVSVATIATLVWTVNKVSDEPTPAERLSAAAGVTAVASPAPVAVTETAEPMPSPVPQPVVQADPVVRAAPVTGLAQFFPMQGEVAPAAAPRPGPPPPPLPGGLPPVNFASLPAPNITLNPGFSIDAIIGAVTGTAGWVGGGTLNLLGDVLVASAMNNQGPRPMLPPPPQWPRELDVTKIPPPQWPRELDITKIPPPHVHWDRLLPRF